jgi:hypothetical protein
MIKKVGAKTHSTWYRVIRALIIAVFALAILTAVLIAVLLIFPLSKAGKVQDEAKLAGRTVDSLPAADVDYFHDMDRGSRVALGRAKDPYNADGTLKLTPDEVKGRDNWIVWSGGNDRFWDAISVKSVGILDLLKTVSSHEGLPAKRGNRWELLGLVNDPCYEAPTGPDPNRWGLWLDKRRTDKPDECGAADPFEDEAKYPGVKVGARGKTFEGGKTVEVGSYYGYNTGIVGLRLFPNPAFDQAAQKHWDAEKYYTDPKYYNDAKLVKPYRVGMSCGFCHVGPNPLNPPADPNNPKWENLSSMVGAQYFWVDKIFSWDGDQGKYFVQLLHTARPGSLDTSLVSTDNINNARTMNAVYGVKARLAMALKWGQEKLAGAQKNNKQFNDYVPDSDPLAVYFTKPDSVRTMHVLKDGADSVGTLGALNRVYINIGLFSEEWLEHFNALVGGKKVTPIEIATAEKNSVYWKATEAQTLYLARFMLASTNAHHLTDAPDGPTYLTKDKEELTRGKVVFAERCARCHSSKLPEFAPGEGLANCAGTDYLTCFERYWKLTQTEDFKAKMRNIVLDDKFLDENYLSTDARIPVTLLRTNTCSPLATNALANNIWDNFSSQSYKDLPSVGSVPVRDPYTGETRDYQMPAGGRGYTRPPSLISIWSTAPLLLNNSVGDFDSDPSVKARVKSFDVAIHQLLWPETRKKDGDQGTPIPAGTPLLRVQDPRYPYPSLIDRTTERSFQRVPTGYLPAPLSKIPSAEQKLLPWLFDDQGARFGPFPAGIPVDLLANIDLLGDSDSGWARTKRDAEVVKLLLSYQHEVGNLVNPTDEQLQSALAKIEPELMQFSKCPDFVVNKGHYFGTKFLTDVSGFPGEPELSDSDKYALIEFLKTF